MKPERRVVRLGLDDALQKVSLELATGAHEVDFKTWAGGSESLSRIYVLTSGPLPPNPGEIVASRRFATVLETLAEEADLVLLDSPAMLAVGDTALAALVDGLVFLVDMQKATRPILAQAADQVVRLPCRSLGSCCASKAPSVATTTHPRTGTTSTRAAAAGGAASTARAPRRPADFSAAGFCTELQETNRAPPPRGEAPCRSRSDGVDAGLGAAAA